MKITGKTFFIYSIILLFLGFVLTYLHPSSAYAASCPASSDTGVYTAPANDPNGNAGKCFSAHGQVGVNVNGLQYTCGPVDCYNPNLTTHTATTPNTCVYYDPVNKNCNTGWGGQGYNPASGCHWNNGTSQVVACPGAAGSPVNQFPIHIHVNGLTQGTTTIRVNDNGYGFNTYTTDASGNISITSFSGDFVTLTPGNNSSYTITPNSITTQTNTNWQCGTSANNPCTFTATATTGGGGGGGGNVANVSLVVGLPGIGQITGPVGVLPQHLTRTVIVELYDASVFNPGGPGTKAVASGKASITYDDGKGSANNAGYFDSVTGGAVPLQISLPVTPPATNEYKIVVEIPQYLHRIALPLTQADQNNPEAFVITSGSTVQMQPLILVPGDVVGVNSMGIDDYTQMKTCFDTPTDPTCTKTPDGIPFADLDDNGVIDLVDFNLFIRSLSLLEQIQPPVCNGLTCIGD